MNFLFAWRYFRSKKSTNAINIIAGISMVAIAVGSAALIIVLSVFNGFEGLVKSLYSDFYADMRIVPASGKTFRITDTQYQMITHTPGIVKSGLVAEEKALLVNGAFQSIVVLKGVDEQYTDINNITGHIRRGRYELGTTDDPGLVMGAGIENAVGAEVATGLLSLTLYTPNKKARFGSIEGLNVFNAKAKGTFGIQQEFDNAYVFSNLSFVKLMLNMQPDEYSAVELKLTGKPETVRKQLQTLLGKGYVVQTRYEQNKSLYGIMQVEKWIIYGILCLILIVAAFNMIGALTMLVLEKQKDIAVLQAIGASEQRIQSIFMTEGLLLAGMGGGAGILLATLFCWLQIQFHLIPLGGDTFIIDYYPVAMSLTDYILVIITVVIIAFIAAWIPSRKASKRLYVLKS